ncbi:hypothetical protein [Paenibacillus sp. N3.4]|uniref:hypothetical protein n=1 Tax=Paenibacillus sp. N3.4 TaxID=2603222 RepID=UPI00164F21FC
MRRLPTAFERQPSQQFNVVLTIRNTRYGILGEGKIRKYGDKMQKEVISNYEDLLVMLDNLLRDPKEFWENFYVDREKEIPF